MTMKRNRLYLPVPVSTVFTALVACLLSVPSLSLAAEEQIEPGLSDNAPVNSANRSSADPNAGNDKAELDSHLPFFGDDNLIEDENQIDTPDELKQATDSPHALSAEDLNRELANPNTPLSSLNLKQVYTSFDGDLPGADQQSSKVTVFQPILPFPLTDDGTTNLFIRPVLAYAWQQPVFDVATNSFKDEKGLLDPGFDVAIGKTMDGGLIAVGGLQGTTAWGSDDLSADQWRLGPEFIVAKISARGFLAVFPAHQWDVSGGDNAYSTSQLELFAGVFLPNAFTLYTDSKSFYDWKENQATIPLNLTLRKVIKFGKIPIKLELSGDYFVEQDDNFGQDWAITLQISPLVPNFIAELLQ